MDEENQALCEFFAESLARRVAGAGAVVTGGENLLLENQKKTRVAVQGDHGEIQFVFSSQQDADDSETFLSLIKIFDQVFPEFRIQDEPSLSPESERQVNFAIRRPDGTRSALSCSFSGQFSQRELEGMRWYVLAAETVAARLLFFRSLTAEPQLCMQIATSGEIYRMEYQGKDSGGLQLFCQRGVYGRDDEENKTDCYFAGTFKFLLPCLGDFLAGVALSVDLPRIIPVLTSGERVGMTRVINDEKGRFKFEEHLAAPEETFLDFQRTDKQTDPSALELAV